MQASHNLWAITRKKRNETKSCPNCANS